MTEQPRPATPDPDVTVPRHRPRHRAIGERRGSRRVAGGDGRVPRALELFAHDVRAPLSAARATLLGVERAALEPAAREAVARAAHELEEVERLVGLLTGRPVAACDGATGHELDVSLVVEAHFTRHSPGPRTIELDLDRGASCVRTPDLARAVEQLLRNAVTHTDFDACVWVRVRLGRRWLEVVVEDDGRGVPRDLREAVFERGERGTTPDSTAGLGIGLALAREIVEDGGGWLVCEERDGGGARFRLRVPHELRRVDVGTP